MVRKIGSSVTSGLVDVVDIVDMSRLANQRCKQWMSRLGSRQAINETRLRSGGRAGTTVPREGAEFGRDEIRSEEGSLRHVIGGLKSSRSSSCPRSDWLT